MPKELATDLVKLSLFDVILYVDDSGEWDAFFFPLLWQERFLRCLAHGVDPIWWGFARFHGV